MIIMMMITIMTRMNFMMNTTIMRMNQNEPAKKQEEGLLKSLIDSTEEVRKAFHVKIPYKKG